MRILLVVRKLNTGGVQNQVVAFAGAALKLNIETHVLILKPCKREMKLPRGVIVHRVSLKSELFTSLRGIWSYLESQIFFPLLSSKSKDYAQGKFYSHWFTRKFLKNFADDYGPPDYIFFRAQGVFDLLHNCRDGNIYRYVDGNPHEYSGILGKRLNYHTYRDASYICVSTELEKRMRHITQSCHAKANIFTYHNFTDIGHIRDQADLPCSISLPKNYIVSVGRLISGKMHSIIIETMQDLPHDLKLIIVGDGPKRRELVDLVNTHNLSSRVIFAGNQENPYPFIKNARALVHTSIREGFGLIFLEALILNTPVVALESEGGMRDILKGPILQQQIVPRDKTILADKIIRTIENPYTSTPDMYEMYDGVDSLKELLQLLERRKQLNITPSSGSD